MEIDIDKLCIVHHEDKIIKIFDTPEEALKHAKTFLPIKVKCDSIHSFMNTAGYIAIKEWVKSCR